MKLVQLRYLIAIADNGLNISTAANQLHRSQPGLSKQLQKLEDELGMQLFLRRGKSLAAVTPAGEHVIDQARLIMREVEKISALTRLPGQGAGKRRANEQKTAALGEAPRWD